MSRLVLLLALPTTLLGPVASAEEEKPRDYPTFVDLQSPTRSTIDLNGQWEFRLDPKDEGVRAGWFRSGVSFGQRIRVPGAVQRFFSGALQSRGPDFTDGDPGSRLCVASFHAAPRPGHETAERTLGLQPRRRLDAELCQRDDRLAVQGAEQLKHRHLAERRQLDGERLP